MQILNIKTLQAVPQYKLLMPANDNQVPVDGFSKGRLDETPNLMPASTPAAAPKARLDPLEYLKENPPAFKQTLVDNARQLEAEWAAKLPAGEGKSSVAIISTDGWVENKFVYLQELADSIIASGGIPKLVFPAGGSVEQQSRGIDALLIPGGNDIHPDFYGASAGPGMKPESCDKGLDAFELALIKQGFEEDKPMLGICRGHQLMNVAAGGTVVQDIDELHKGIPGSAKLNHWNDAAAKNRALRVHSDHGIQILNHTQLSKAIGGYLAQVNSIHHQCLGSIAPGMAVVAWSMEAQPVPEAIERLGHPHQTGVQFHPEFTRKDSAPSQQAHQRIFDILVNDGSKFANLKAANDDHYAPLAQHQGWLLQA